MSRNLFAENAYNILGLDSGASEKEILKRSREIENLLKIDVTPEYNSDLPSSKLVRTEAKVKRAAERLTTPDKKLAETFFWLILEDDTDETALNLFRAGDHINALKVLQNKIAASPNNYTAIRNKAVLESLIFTEKAQNKYLEASLKSWQTILTSDKQWADFKRIYKLNNPATSDALFENFRKIAEKTLASFYEDMSKTENNPEIYAAFSNRFSAHSDSFDKDILDPLLNKLNACTKKIRDYHIKFNTNISQTSKWLSAESRSQLTKLTDEANAITDEIQALGEKVWGRSRTKVVRDENALALRSLAIDIVNNTDILDHYEDKELADYLLWVAYNICSEDSATEKRIEKDQHDFNEIASARKFKKEFEEVIRHIESRNLNLAISKLDELLAKDDLPAKARSDLQNLRLRCVTAAKMQSTSRMGNSENGWTWVIGAIIISLLIWFFATILQ